MSYSSAIEVSFSGVSGNPVTYPIPYNGLGVGSNYVLMAEASTIEWADEAGNGAVTQSVYQFFQPLGSTATNALRAIGIEYDEINQRWIVIADKAPMAVWSVISISPSQRTAIRMMDGISVR